MLVLSWLNMAQFDLNMAQFDLNMAQHGPTWPQHGPIWPQHGSTWPSKTFKNIEKPMVFLMFFVVWGGPSGAIWRPSWAMLAHLGDKMGYVGPSWRYLAPSWRQDAT